MRHTHVAEACYRLVINEFLGLTDDLQYMNDTLREANGPDGELFGQRTTLEF